MTQTYGYAIPIVQDVADHTWVYADDGFCCGCPDYWGRGCSEEDRRNGRVVCQGQGDTNQARCMAGGLDSWLLIPLQVGVTYAINGLCHQMANRILLSTGRPPLQVWEASGAIASYSNFGEWGTMVSPAAWLISPIAAGILLGKAFLEFNARCAACGIASPFFAFDQGMLAQAVLSPEADMPVIPSEGEIMELADDHYGRSVQELDELYGRMQGKARDDRLARVKEIYAAYHRPDRNLVLGAVVDSTDAEAPPSPEEMAQRVAAANAFAQQPLMEAANFLSEAEFQAIYGHSPEEPVPLIEADILVRAVSEPFPGES